MAGHLYQYLDHCAKNYGEQIAVVHKDASLTYAELANKAHQVARGLCILGLERGDRVAIYLDKSIDALVSIYGVLLSGAAYVSLDPDAPAKRLGLILEDAQPFCVISTAKKLKKLESLEALPRCVTVENLQMAENAPAFPARLIDPDDLAYIIYTSGSTGIPKGVAISHRASMAFVDWAATCFEVTAQDQLSSSAPFHFDLSIFDIFVASRSGATLHLVPKECGIFPASLASFIADSKISVWYSVPWILSQLAQRGQLAQYDFSHLRTILFAGEVFPIKQLRLLAEQIPDAGYHNLYGPTETNVCTFYSVKGPELNEERPLPIGVGVPQGSCYVVDESGRPVARGEEGHLVVSGPLLMSGYWRNEEATAKAFMDVILPDGSKERAYRTGDLVREESDGNLRFHGRMDHMIKRRGYRIELGEIEAALNAHPEIEEAVVVPSPGTDELMLTCFYVAAKELSLRDLKSHCARRIPKYMMPDQFRMKPSLPKTSTGKVDRQSLARTAERFSKEK